jgi:hypothetical protein
MLIMDQPFLILMSEYNTEDKISREFDPDRMVGLSEWYYSDVVNRDTTCIKIWHLLILIYVDQLLFGKFIV